MHLRQSRGHFVWSYQRAPRQLHFYDDGRALKSCTCCWLNAARLTSNRETKHLHKHRHTNAKTLRCYCCQAGNPPFQRVTLILRAVFHVFVLRRQTLLPIKTLYDNHHHHPLPSLFFDFIFHFFFETKTEL